MDVLLSDVQLGVADFLVAFARAQKHYHLQEVIAIAEVLSSFLEE